ncbi:MAG: glycoside hydrolase domain-containing protein [Candidatus Acidiferrum sp.]
MRPRLSFLTISAIAAALILFSCRSGTQPNSQEQQAPRAYLGFDLNIFPGKNPLPALRKTFFFSSYWLSPPPGEKTNTWLGKRDLLRSQGFGFLLLYRGPLSRELKNGAAAVQKGILDARNATATAKQEGFPAEAIIFLDIEEGGRLPAAYHAYLRAWAGRLAEAGYRAGAYCSGIPVKEERGVTITTADDIRAHAPSADFVYFIFNDVCPPSPGCTFPQNPPSPATGGIPYAALWQFAQSPRRMDRTAHCAPGYHTDGNCYAPSDTAHAWFLDVDTATSSDPSNGAGAEK